MTSSGLRFCCSLRRNSSSARLHRARADAAALPRGRFAIARTEYFTAAFTDRVGIAIADAAHARAHDDDDDVGRLRVCARVCACVRVCARPSARKGVGACALVERWM